MLLITKYFAKKLLICIDYVAVCVEHNPSH